MNRKILLQVAGPTVGVGLLLLAVCLVSAWQINRLQTNLAHLRTRNVASLQAAQEMEIQLRRLRFNSFIYLADPAPELKARIDDSRRTFEAALARAREAAFTDEERGLLDRVEEGYHRYREE